MDIGVQGVLGPGMYMNLLLCDCLDMYECMFCVCVLDNLLGKYTRFFGGAGHVWVE